MHLCSLQVFSHNFSSLNFRTFTNTIFNANCQSCTVSSFVECLIIHQQDSRSSSLMQVCISVFVCFICNTHTLETIVRSSTGLATSRWILYTSYCVGHRHGLNLELLLSFSTPWVVHVLSNWFINFFDMKTWHSFLIQCFNIVLFPCVYLCFPIYYLRQ